MKKLISELDQANNYQKGIAMERLACYYLETIERNTNNWNENKNRQRRN